MLTSKLLLFSGAGFLGLNLGIISVAYSTCLDSCDQFFWYLIPSILIPVAFFISSYTIKKTEGMKNINDR